ncbi:phage minor capsid protein [Petroclostridium sp. X23]|uniref:phage minor capsid protein n=1 Tax=Petroclostridium sp. X23 TaxID=3045146 RepID=UPI0024ADCAE7|nr:phage minor capsid protein [Petroclostridium sp. X23]WHH58473.1 polymorphic toxin type 50 domain-containing protein [Petroclostridium sp. X23]
MNPYDIAHIFFQMEYDLIDSMKRNFARHRAEEIKEGFEWEQWQQRKLEGLAQYRKNNQKILNKYDNEISQEVEKLIKDSFSQGAKNTDSFINRMWDRLKTWFIAGKVTRPITEVDGSDDSFFKINENRINSLINAVKNDFSKGKYAMLRQADDVYRQTVFKSQMYLNAGASSLYQAVDMATDSFLDKGFNCIEFKDGRRMNIASYAEMALRASSQRAVFVGGGARRDEWGIHTVVVSAHNNCSELCLPWQGRVYIDDVYSSGVKGEVEYPLLSFAIDNGLFHPNCRHNMSPWFDGISSLPDPVDDEDALENYEAEQKQRYIGRQIRRYKRHEAGSLYPDNQVKASQKVNEWQNKLREHLKDNPQLRRDPWREQVKGGIAPKQRNENLKRAAESARIEAIKEKISNGEISTKIKEQKQQEHILGSKKWLNRVKMDLKNNKSPADAFFKNTDIQKLIQENAGTGIINFRKNQPYPVEFISIEGNVGVAFDFVKRKYVKTNRFAIRYSSKGVHAHPVLPRKEN